MSAQPTHEMQTLPDEIRLFNSQRNPDGSVIRTFRFDTTESPTYGGDATDEHNKEVAEGYDLGPQKATGDTPEGEVMSKEAVAVQRAQETLNDFKGTVKQRDSQVSTKLTMLVAEQNVLDASQQVAQQTIERLGSSLLLAGTAVKQRENLLRAATKNHSQAKSLHEEKAKTPIEVVDELMLALAGIRANILHGGTETVDESEARFTTIRSTIESLHDGTYLDDKGVPHRLIELVTATAIAVDDVRMAQQARDFEQAALEREAAQRDSLAVELDNFVQQLEDGKELLGSRMRMTEYYDQVASSDKTLADRIRTALRTWKMQRRGELPTTDDTHFEILPNIDTQQAITKESN